MFYLKAILLLLVLSFFSSDISAASLFLGKQVFSKPFLNSFVRRAFSSHISWAEKIIGVSRGASKGKINEAFKAKALECHPDCTGDICCKDFRELRAAQELMLNYVPREEESTMSSSVNTASQTFKDCTEDERYMAWVMEQIKKSQEDL